MDWDRQRHSILSIREELQTFDVILFSSNFCEPPTYSTPLKPQGRLGEEDHLATPPSLGEEHPELLLSARDVVRCRVHRADPRLLLEWLGSGKNAVLKDDDSLDGGFRSPSLMVVGMSSLRGGE
ncbi:hypothetical protein TB2_044090 [Malus domestica]